MVTAIVDGQTLNLIDHQLIVTGPLGAGVFAAVVKQPEMLSESLVRELPAVIPGKDEIGFESLVREVIGQGIVKGTGVHDPFGRQETLESRDGIQAVRKGNIDLLGIGGLEKLGQEGCHRTCISIGRQVVGPKGVHHEKEYIAGAGSAEGQGV